MDKLLGINRLAGRLRRLGVTRDWLLQEAKAGRLPHLRIGRRLIFNVDAVTEAIASRAAELPTPSNKVEEVACGA
jgi:hypothetical protein